MPDKQFLLFLDDVRLPAEALIGQEDAALSQLFAGLLNPERIMAAAGSVGMGRFALDRGVSYAKEREVWGKPIGTHQGLSHPLAKAKVELEMAKLMMQKAATLYDGGDEMGAGEAANMAKYAAAEASPSPASTRPSRPSVATGSRTSTGWATLLDRSPGGTHRARQPRDGAELRRPVQPGPAQVLLTEAAGGVRRATILCRHAAVHRRVCIKIHLTGGASVPEIVHYAVERAIATVTFDSPAQPQRAVGATRSPRRSTTSPRRPPTTRSARSSSPTPVRRSAPAPT